MKNFKPVTCPYCHQPAKLVDSATIYRGRSYGMMWDCRPCDAYVGIHKNSPTNAPLGRLANAELRAWKIKAHAAFDPLWVGGGMTRKEAYKLLMERMGMTADQAHIGKFDVEECKRVAFLFAGGREGAGNQPESRWRGYGRGGEAPKPASREGDVDWWNRIRAKNS